MAEHKAIGSEPDLSEQALESLIFRDEEFQALDAEFDRFCPFEALGVIGYEIRHANFLAYMFDPNRPHGFGSKLLREFLMTACAAPDGLTARDMTAAPRSLDYGLANYDDVDVRREWRNIDLLIVLRSAKIVVAVELKVEASQHADQLQRYRRIVEQEWSNGWRRAFIFLTKEDEIPADDNWIPCRFSKIVLALERLAGTSNDKLADAMLTAYVAMLRRHHVENERLEQIARNLWARHYEALSFLTERKPDAAKEALEQVRADGSSIIVQLLTDGLQFTLDEGTDTIIRFAVPAWDTVPGFLSGSGWTKTKRLILLEIKLRRDQGARRALYEAVAYLGPGEVAARTAIARALMAEFPAFAAKEESQYARIAGERLLTVRSDDQEDSPETFAKQIEEKFIQFAIREGKKIDTCLRTPQP